VGRHEESCHAFLDRFRYASYFCRDYRNARAKPVVVFNVGGLRETVGEGGLLIPDGDAECFVESAVWLLKSSDARSKLGVEARKQALKYEFHAREKRLVEVYEEARRRDHA